MIKDLEEKQLQVAYFLSRGNRSVEEKFTEFNICKVWLGCIFEGTQVPKDILELAKTRTKDLKVRLAQNRDKNLSGFDLLIFYNCRDTMRLNNVPFGLSEKTVRNYIESMPIKSVLVEKESKE